MSGHHPFVCLCSSKISFILDCRVQGPRTEILTCENTNCWQNDDFQTCSIIKFILDCPKLLVSFYIQGFVMTFEMFS